MSETRMPDRKEVPTMYIDGITIENFDLGGSLNDLPQPQKNEIIELLKECFLSFHREFRWQFDFHAEEQEQRSNLIFDCPEPVMVAFWNSDPPITLRLSPDVLLQAIDEYVLMLAFGIGDRANRRLDHEDKAALVAIIEKWQAVIELALKNVKNLPSQDPPA